MLALAQAHAAVAARYSDAGWTVINMPKGCIVDFIASSGGSAPRIHYIQVVTPAIEKTARFSLEAQNAFIQNAMSNAAAPVYANVAADGKISCVDVNTRSRVIITKREQPATSAPKIPATSKIPATKTPAKTPAADASKKTPTRNVTRRD